MAGRHVNDLLLDETTGKLSAELTLPEENKL